MWWATSSPEEASTERHLDCSNTFIILSFELFYHPLKLTEKLGITWQSIYYLQIWPIYSRTYECIAYLKKALNILEKEHSAIWEVWLLWDFGATPTHIVLGKVPGFHRRFALFDQVCWPVFVFTLQPISQRCSHFGPTTSLQRVKYQDTRPGKKVHVDLVNQNLLY